MDAIAFRLLNDVPQHIDVLADWFQTEWPEHFADHDPGEHFRAECNRDALPMAIVALAGDTPVGTVALRERSVEAQDDHSPWIGGLYVHPEIRGSGVGTALTRVAVTTAWSMGYDSLYVGSTHRGFFEKLGWQPLDRGDVLALTRPPTLYEQLGGEEVVLRLVTRFYDIMDERADASVVRGLHAASLKVSRDKLFKFLSGWTGGPNLYIEQYGHPRLRARHLPFAIGTRARDEWMLCMEAAIAEVVEDVATARELNEAFARMADHMINRPGEL